MTGLVVRWDVGHFHQHHEVWYHQALRVVANRRHDTILFAILDTNRR